MSHPSHVKAAHKAIQAYYQTLQAYREHDFGHETALRSAFQNLLAEIGQDAPLAARPRTEQPRRRQARRA